MSDSVPLPPINGEPGKERRNWTPMIIGGAVVVLIVVGLVVFGVLGRSPGANPADPYLAKLELSNLRMAKAENFAGGSVTYVEGTLVNTGDKKVTAATVQVTFKNNLGEISQKETVPVTVVTSNPAYVDYGTLDRAPLAPGQRRAFRLTLEYVTPDWDGQLPLVKVVGITTGN
ncbi:MAG TPA: hypothetical protein VKL40_02775 [Candidatus Angelobacter sp.]|nr:hypothetical protein [Candidatus Angelobacter sp.]